MTWRNVMVKDGDYLRLKLDNLEIEKGGRKFCIPLSDIATLTLEGDLLTITTKLLARLSKYNIAVIICDNRYLPCGIFTSFGQYHRTAKRNLEQSVWTQKNKDSLWRDIVFQKIRNQKAVLELKNCEQERIEKMRKLLEQLQLGDRTNREGHAAKVYFNTLFGMAFTRDENCLENAALDYGYTIIRAYVARVVASVGLIPSLGVFHRNEYNSFNLVDDLMEPFRPLMDWYVLEEILPNYSDYLTWDARCKLIDFLNLDYSHRGKKTTIDLIILEYVNSFIRAMKGEMCLLEVELEGMRGV